MSFHDVSRSAQPVPAPVERVHVMGNTLTFHLRSSMTGGGFTLVECETLPGAGTPPHLQSRDDEAYFVLKGRYEFRIGDARVTRGPRSFVQIPRGTLHAFRNADHAPARMLILNWPGGLHEAFFDAIGTPMDPHAAEPPAEGPALPALLAAAKANGIELMRPG